MALVNKVLIPFLSALIGGGAVAAAVHYSPGLKSKLVAGEAQSPQPSPQKQKAPGREPVFDDEVFREPFEEMHELMANMNLPEDLHGGFDGISQREDDKYVYFDVKVDDPKTTAINTRVENGYVDISGSVQKKNQNDSEESEYHSTFHKSFPVPENVDANKMEIDSDQNKYVLKFPKIKA